MFPLGAHTKADVRALAAQYGLRNAQKDESYEICFVANNNYEQFLREQVPEVNETIKEGSIVLDDRVVGVHRGYPFYTIGQRRGIGAHGRKMYVTEILPDANIVKIGPEGTLLGTGLTASRLNWVGVDGLREPEEVMVKVRYKDDPSPAVAVLTREDRLEVSFRHPKRAITPGQSVVLYQGDMLMGGGVIDEAVK
jgi:tRNA-specific 2-thiouridylase